MTKSSQKTGAKPSAKNESKIESSTPASKSIEEQIADARMELLAVNEVLQLAMSGTFPYSKRAKVHELQDRLTYRAMKYELDLLRERIIIFKECIQVLS